VNALTSACDQASQQPGQLPDDLAACVSDLGAASCTELGHFQRLSADFPPSCQNLQPVETALGVLP
jgi:hypothetical protein